MRQLPHPGAEEMTLTGVLAALSDPVRLEIVSTLANIEGERAWGEFDVGVCASTLSHHMKVLRLAGVIDHRKDGTRCFVSLRSDLDRVFPGLLECILKFTAPAERRQSFDAPSC
jgi:DNA-binding transcriptional ArsR family regulator